MPDTRFRGDPYRTLELPHDATDAQIKRRWRELAREHHPDRAAGDGEEAARLTARMARINAAYDVLRDRTRRAAYDGSPAGRSAKFEEEDAFAGERGGPPPPPRTRPVTARFDTSAGLRPRNNRTGAPPSTMRGHSPRSSRDGSQRDLRASTPTGPVHRRAGRLSQPLPSLQEAREATLNFGRFHGYTLGEVELLEPSYIDWVARTITRDRDLVIRARLIQSDLDDRGVARPSRPATPGFGSTYE